MPTEKYSDKKAEEKAEEKTDNIFKTVLICRKFVHLFDIGNKIVEKKNACTKKIHTIKKICAQCGDLFCFKCAKNSIALFNKPGGATLTDIKDLCSCCISGNLLITAYVHLKNKISGKNVPITPEDVLKEMMDNEKSLKNEKEEIEKSKKKQ